jgi:hypothetical protein
VDPVADVLGPAAGRDRGPDEEPDDLALGRLDLLADDRQAGCQPLQDQRALGGVVVGQRDAVEPQLGGAGDERLQAGATVGGVA